MPTDPRPLVIVAGNAHPALAAALARELRASVRPAEVGAFADGEGRVRIGADVRGADVVIVQPTARPSTST